MTWLAENALPIWVGGAVALTMAMFVYLQTRSRGAFYGVLAVIAITAGLLLVNRLVETRREAVEHALYSLAATVEANDVPGALAFLAPNANSAMRRDVETLMPQVKIERARVIGTPEIELNATEDAATIKCRGIILAVNRKDGMKGGGDDHMVLEWVRSGEQWLLVNYTSEKDWNRELGRARANK